MKRLQHRSLLLSIALFFASIGMSILLFQPAVREMTTEWVYSTDRKILSIVKTEISEEPIHFLKVRVANVIYLEVYRPGMDRAQELLARAELTDSKDAFYKLPSGESNLFLQDVDGDGNPEVVAPSYDKNMIAHLNIYQFDLSSKELRKLSNH